MELSQPEKVEKVPRDIKRYKSGNFYGWKWRISLGDISQSEKEREKQIKDAIAYLENKWPSF